MKPLWFTALIGKNDSGKSNVLEILGAISFRHYILDEFYKFNNGSENDETFLKVELKFTNKELDQLKEYKIIFLCPYRFIIVYCHVWYSHLFHTPISIFYKYIL